MPTISSQPKTSSTEMPFFQRVVFLWPQLKPKFRGMMLGLLITIIGISILVALHSAHGNPASKEETAYYMACAFVQRDLKCPMTAHFLSYNGDAIKPVINQCGDESWEIGSCVDSQNSFGALIRTTFYCRVTHIDQDNWQCDELKFGDD